MRVVREFTRWVARWSRFDEPRGDKVTVCLIEANGAYYLKTPWAFVAAVSGRDTTDAQMGAMIAPCFDTEAEAVAWANLQAPHWFDKRNDTVRSRLHDCIRWDGDFLGPCRLADALGISEERLRGLVSGKFKATPREARLAREYKGQPV